jgi:hypothetical protein
MECWKGMDCSKEGGVMSSLRYGRQAGRKQSGIGQ